MAYYQSYVTMTNGRLYTLEVIAGSGHEEACAMMRELASTFPNASGFEISQGTLKVHYDRPVATRPPRARKSRHWLERSQSQPRPLQHAGADWSQDRAHGNEPRRH